MGERRTDTSVAELRRVSDEVDRALRSFVDRQPLREFYDLMRYHLGWRTPNGPPAVRPRSTLCILACQAGGGSLEAALPMAVAIALLYNFLANEQDLESGREMSRGRRTVASMWSTPQAMNAGDGLHALAKMALLEARDRIPAPAILHLEEELDECTLRSCEAIHHELLSGESMELAAQKTAGLFGCAAYAGCYLARADEAMAEELRRFGDLLGSAAGVAGLDRRRTDDYRGQALDTLAASSLEEPQRAPFRALLGYVLNGS